MPDDLTPVQPRRHRGITATALLTVAAVAGALLALPSAAVGAETNAPDAPTRLTVEDDAQPLGTDLTPRFGWLPQDEDANEVQSAYRIRVVDAADAVRWDSGKVAASDQSYIDYGGEALEPGSTYSWTVQTWDRDDQASPWAEEASFDTGLGDGDWGGAEWIRRAPGNPDASSLSIVDGKGRVNGGDVTLVKTGADWTDYVVTMDVTPITRAAALVFRGSGDRNGYMWQLHANDNALKTHRMVAGGFPTDARRSVPMTIDTQVTYQTSIRVEGQTFTTSIGGAVVDTWTDPSSTGSTQGTIGLRMASGEVAEFDNIRVTSLDGSQVLFSEDFDGTLDQWVRGTTNREADEYTLARTVVDLPEGEIVRARSYLAASHIGELYLNGERADRMSNFGYPGEGYFHVADVTPMVEAGEELAVGAMLHWFSSGQGRAGVEPGLLARIVVEYADGSEVVVVTDDSWNVRRGPYRMVGTRNGEGLYIEHLEGPAVAAIGDWKQPSYDDSDWAEAVVLGAHPHGPWSRLEGDITRMSETVVHPERILIAEDGTPVADFGVVIPARPAVTFENGQANRVIPIRGSLGLAANGRVSTAGVDTQGTNMSWPYTQVAGAQQYEAFGHLAFRYLEIPDAGEPITVDDVTATILHVEYPEDGAATFESSNDTLNAVWDLMDRSLRYSVQETFVDTPTREQGQFLHDTINISDGLMATQFERNATRKAIREFMFSQERWWSSTLADSGRYNAVYPNGDGKRDIPDFTQVVPDWIWEYYEETGDREMLEEVYDNISATADYVRRHIPTEGPTAGLVTRLTGGSGQYNHGIVDWPAHGRFGYDMGAAARTTVNALGVDVLRKVALVAEALERPDDEVQAYRDDADALAQRMNETLRGEDGIYVDGLSADGTQSAHAGQHSTSYAIAFGIAPEEDLPALGAHIASMGMKQGPMTSHFLLNALATSGQGDGLLNLLTNEDDFGWAQWLKQGGTFTPEAWELSGSANSGSHGWGAQGVVDILASVLGIEITEAGAAGIRISVPDTGLESAEGSQVTQRGRVSSSWTRDGNDVTLSTTIPVNVTAVVEVPNAVGIDYAVEGPGGATAESLGVDGGIERFRVGSGTWTFTGVEHLPASVDVTPRTLAGKAYLSIEVVNDADVPVDVAVTTPYGKKSFAQVAPGKTVAVSVNTRLTEVPAGDATVEVTGVVAGESVSETKTVPYGSYSVER